MMVGMEPISRPSEHALVDHPGDGIAGAGHQRERGIAGTMWSQRVDASCARIRRARSLDPAPLRGTGLPTPVSLDCLEPDVGNLYNTHIRVVVKAFA